MLKINPNPQFKADVKITVPGQQEPGVIGLTFKYKNRKDIIAFWDEHKDDDDADLFMDFVAGWEGIDAEFTKESVAAFLNNYPAAGREIANEYQRLLLVSRIKN